MNSLGVGGGPWEAVLGGIISILAGFGGKAIVVTDKTLSKTDIRLPIIGISPNRWKANL